MLPIYWRSLVLSVALCCLTGGQAVIAACEEAADVKDTAIDREALVLRHMVINEHADPLSALSVGNGRFAFTVDITGLQSFPEYYEKGIPLGTESEWGWHSFIDTSHFRLEEAVKEYAIHGREIGYAVQWDKPKRNKEAADWFRQNPHRLQLGNIGFELIKKDGTQAGMEDITKVHQELNMWTGEIRSRFALEGIPVELITMAHPDQDLVAVRVSSLLIGEGRLHIRIRFPYPTGAWSDVGDNWEQPDRHRSEIVDTGRGVALLEHILDTTHYFLSFAWSGLAHLQKKGPHYFLLTPINPASDGFSFSFHFSPGRPPGSGTLHTTMPSFEQTRIASVSAWKDFWMKGGAIDLSGSTDPRAGELERRIILSQYLTRIQCAGNYPPQETGLTYNSWFGKPHLEMHWWHSAHFALWERPELLEGSLGWYARVAAQARRIAERQGFKGTRWQKMTDPAGEESPSSVGAFLVWQQPHFIYFAELSYRDHPDRATLDKYKSLVFGTADFMASYAWYDEATHRYILGKGLIPAQEKFRQQETFDPCFELAYWRWALSTAQQWRMRLGMAADTFWQRVLDGLAPLPRIGDLYLPAESATDAYSNENYRSDHPVVMATYGFLPFTSGLDTVVLRNSFDWVWKNWNWAETWGWDFPLVAMTATRLGLPDRAIDALLMPVQKNTYLVDGHNYQDDRLRLYLPGNGGLLAAVALMCAGYDGCTRINPGIPQNGKWKVRWEGLQKMP
jgi:protein-glucosylgalactosylhydroxylysine glucosidase